MSMHGNSWSLSQQLRCPEYATDGVASGAATLSCYYDTLVKAYSALVSSVNKDGRCIDVSEVWVDCAHGVGAAAVEVTGWEHYWVQGCSDSMLCDISGTLDCPQCC